MHAYVSLYTMYYYEHIIAVDGNGEQLRARVSGGGRHEPCSTPHFDVGQSMCGTVNSWTSRDFSIGAELLGTESYLLVPRT